MEVEKDKWIGWLFSVSVYQLAFAIVFGKTD